MARRLRRAAKTLSIGWPPRVAIRCETNRSPQPSFVEARSARSDSGVGSEELRHAIDARGLRLRRRRRAVQRRRDGIEPILSGGDRHHQHEHRQDPIHILIPSAAHAGRVCREGAGGTIERKPGRVQSRHVRAGRGRALPPPAARGSASPASRSASRTCWPSWRRAPRRRWPARPPTVTGAWWGRVALVAGGGRRRTVGPGVSAALGARLLAAPPLRPPPPGAGLVAGRSRQGGGARGRARPGRRAGDLRAARARRAWWWLIAAAVFFVVGIALAALFPVLIVPLFYRLTPLAESRAHRHAAGAGAAGGRRRGGRVGRRRVAQEPHRQRGRRRPGPDASDHPLRHARDADFAARRSRPCSPTSSATTSTATCGAGCSCRAH